MIPSTLATDRVLILPILSDKSPARIRPAALKTARTETAVLAIIAVIPTILAATADACEITIIPLNAPQVNRRSIT